MVCGKPDAFFSDFVAVGETQQSGIVGDVSCPLGIMWQRRLMPFAKVFLWS